LYAWPVPQILIWSEYELFLDKLNMNHNIIYNIVCLTGTSLHSAPTLDPNQVQYSEIFLLKFFGPKIIIISISSRMITVQSR
jgi:hypothetical protein